MSAEADEENIPDSSNSYAHPNIITAVDNMLTWLSVLEQIQHRRFYSSACGAPSG
jgi:hypothetical protein